MRLNYDDIKTTIKNKELCKEFPFLIPIESVGKESVNSKLSKRQFLK